MKTLNHQHLRLCAGLLAASAFSSPAVAQGSGAFTPVATYYIPLNDTPIANGLATLNGNVYLGAPQIKVCLGNDSSVPSACADESVFALSLEAGFSVEVRSVTGGAVAADLPLPPLTLGVITFPGAIGVTGQVIVTSELHLEGDLEAGIVTSLVGHIDARGENSQRRNGKQVSGFFAPSNVHFRFTPPEITGSTGLNLTASLSAKVSVIISIASIPVLEPYLQVVGGVDLSVNPVGNPWWEANGFVELEAGFDNVFPGAPSFALAPRRYEFDIVDAGGDLASWIPRPLRLAQTLDLEDIEDATAATPFGQGYLVVGNSGNAGNLGWLAHLDEDGAQIWEQRNLGTTDAFMRPTDVFVTPSGQIAVTGNETISSLPRLNVFEPNGIPTWSRTYLEAGGSLLATDFSQTDDGGYVFTGTVLRGVTVRPIVVRLDALGNVLWAREFEVPAASHSGKGWEVIETTKGDIVVVGEVTWANGPIFQATLDGQNAFVWRLDAGGNTLSMRVMGTIGSDMGYAITELENGDILVAGRVSNLIEEHAGWLTRLNRDGAIVWSICVAGEVLPANPGSGDWGDETLNGLATVKGGALVSGTSGAGPAEESWLLEVTNNGTIVWFKSFRAPGEDEFRGLVALEDGILTWGRTRSLQPLGTGGAEDEMWIARTGQDGMLQFDSANGYDAFNDLCTRDSASSVVIEDLPGWPLAFGPTFVIHPLAFDVTGATVTVLTE